MSPEVSNGRRVAIVAGCRTPFAKASTVYRDASSGCLCKTFGLFLDEARVLLVDAEVGDDVLYATAPARQPG